MANAATAKREARIRSLTELVQYFDPTNPIHKAHYTTLKTSFGEMHAAMIVSQDAHRHLLDGKLELTDAGAINTHAGWRKLNRIVKHGQTYTFTIFDFDAETKAGGRLVPLFTRDQTVPAYEQED